MAEQAASTVASAVIGGIADKTLDTVIQKLRAPAAAAHEKLQRLELLVLKFRSAIEVSEKHAIGSASLLEWRDRLKEAAAESGEVLLHFQRRAAGRKDDDGAEASKSAADNHDRRQQSAVVYFTRSSLSGVAQRVRDAARRLFSADEDMKKLDSSLERMELLSPDITQFAMLLQLEVLPKLGQPPAKRKVPASNDPSVRRIFRTGSIRMVILPKLHQQQRNKSSHHVTLPDSEEGPRWEAKAEAALEEDLQLASTDAEDPENEAGMLRSVLQQALRRLVESQCIKAAGDRDMEGIEWLAQWATVLRGGEARVN